MSRYSQRPQSAFAISREQRVEGVGPLDETVDVDRSLVSVSGNCGSSGVCGGGNALALWLRRECGRRIVRLFSASWKFAVRITDSCLPVVPEATLLSKDSQACEI